MNYISLHAVHFSYRKDQHALMSYRVNSPVDIHQLPFHDVLTTGLQLVLTQRVNTYAEG